MQNSYYIKICGLTNSLDAGMAIEFGSDFLGMVLHPQSKRRCAIHEAKKIKQQFPSKPRVLVFGYDSEEYIIQCYSELKNIFTFIQIPHDHPSFSTIVSLLTSAKVFPAVSVKSAISESELEKYKDHSIMILDAPAQSDESGHLIPGGTGKTFPWEYINAVKRPFLLAGGLNSQNIVEALQIVEPFGLDIASGLEKSPGIKDANKFKLFFDAVASVRTGKEI